MQLQLCERACPLCNEELQHILANRAAAELQALQAAAVALQEDWPVPNTRNGQPCEAVQRLAVL